MRWLSILHSIQLPQELKTLSIDSLTEVCKELREEFINTISTHGGHFAGNLGVVELTVALHYEFDFLKHKIIWDVGHQSYIHKMITGRRDDLPGIRSLNGISGFPKMSESNYDHFGTGHSSTALSAAMGMAAAARLNNQTDIVHIPIVGDGALTGGMTLEALNNLAANYSNVLLIINDNHIGIDPNTGAIDKHLQEMEANKPNIFTNLGIPYFGPVDGHNLTELIAALQSVKEIKGPRVLHVKTIKGKGFAPAEAEQTRWHSTTKYVKLETGNSNHGKKWQDVFADSLMELASLFPDLVGITPAMPSGSGMIKPMLAFPERFFDVGIAEQHAVTFAAGLAAAGKIPILNIYSTFLQRGYDQLIHDAALQKLPVIFCIDRAGLVGEDGPTHHGAFDIAFLRCIPDIILAAPSNAQEFRNLLYTACTAGKPFAIRYPKGNIPATEVEPAGYESLQIGKGTCVKKGKNTAVIGIGLGTELASQAILKSNSGASLYDIRFVKPLDKDLLQHIFSSYNNIITIEDGSISGGCGEEIRILSQDFGFTGKITNLGIPDCFVEHGDNAQLYSQCGYGVEKIIELLSVS